jgi:hypothetical protein
MARPSAAKHELWVAENGAVARVTVVAPGVIATHMQGVSTPTQIAAAVATIPMGRVGKAFERVPRFREAFVWKPTALNTDSDPP